MIRRTWRLVLVFVVGALAFVTLYAEPANACLPLSEPLPLGSFSGRALSRTEVTRNGYTRFLWTFDRIRDEVSDSREGAQFPETVTVESPDSNVRPSGRYRIIDPMTGPACQQMHIDQFKSGYRYSVTGVFNEEDPARMGSVLYILGGPDPVWLWYDQLSRYVVGAGCLTGLAMYLWSCRKNRSRTDWVPEKW